MTEPPAFDPNRSIGRVVTSAWRQLTAWADERETEDEDDGANVEARRPRRGPDQRLERDQGTRQEGEGDRSHGSLPGAEHVARVGGRPLRDPQLVDGHEFAGPGFRAVLFRIPGTRTRVLLALGSATKINLGEDDNAFVRILADVLAEEPVESLWVSDFARLLRSIDYLSDTWKAVRDNCHFVRHAGAVIDTSGPTAEIQCLFEALSAAADARSTVKRTIKGKMRSYLDGKCPFGSHAVPDGFRRAPDRTLEADPNFPTGVIARIVDVLGDPGLTDSERVAAVAAVGGTSRRTRALGRRIPVDQLTNPSATVARWYGYLDTWKTGRWELDYRIPALLNQEVFDLPVELDEKYGTRVWHLTFDLPIPPRGFATDEAFEAAVHLRDRRLEHATPTGGASAGAVRKPFCGLPSWVDGDLEFVLLSKAQRLYELRARPVDQSRTKLAVDGQVRWVKRGWGRGSKKEGHVVATVHAAELHQQVTEGLVYALSTGLTVRSASDAVMRADTHTPLIEDLRRRLSDARRRSSNAQRNSNSAQTEAARLRFLRDMEAADVEARGLEEDLLRLARADDGRLPVDVDKLASTLAVIAVQEGHVPGAVADAYRAVIQDFRLIPIDHELARWEASIRLPLIGGTISVGPATGTVALGTSRTLAAIRNDSLSARAADATHKFMAQDLALEDVSAQLGISTYRRVAQTIRNHLGTLGLSSASASLLVGQGTHAARSVVWERLRGRPFPAHVARPFAAHLESVYISDGTTAPDPNRAATEKTIRGVLVAIEDLGGWVPANALGALADEAGISAVTLGYYARGRRRNGKDVPAVLMEVDGGVGLLPCPHPGCSGWATVVCTLPEVPTQVLCHDCLRMPLHEYADVEFTEHYRAT